MKILLLTLFLLASCGKDCEECKDPEFVNTGLLNENSYLFEDKIYMTTNETIDSSYHRWRSPFSFKLPTKIKPTRQSGNIDAKLIFSDNTFVCEYLFDGNDFVLDFCTGDNNPNFYVGSCVFLRIEGTRNFEVTVELEEV